MSAHTLRGHCLCGAVRIVTDVDSRTVSACHCSLSRRWGGGPLLVMHCSTSPQFEGLAPSAHDSCLVLLCQPDPGPDLRAIGLSLRKQPWRRRKVAHQGLRPTTSYEVMNEAHIPTNELLCSSIARCLPRPQPLAVQ